MIASLLAAVAPFPSVAETVKVIYVAQRCSGRSMKQYVNIPEAVLEMTLSAAIFTSHAEVLIC